jgi:hypothetical protein
MISVSRSTTSLAHGQRKAGKPRGLDFRGPLLIALFTTAIAAASGSTAWLAVAVALTSFSFAWWVISLGKTLAIIPTIAVIACVQWLLAPMLAYDFELVSGRQRMYLDVDKYMLYMVPSTMLFIFISACVTPYMDLASIARSIRSQRLIAPRVIIAIWLTSLFSGYLVSAAPAILAFVFYLWSQVQFVCLLYLLIIKERRGLFLMAVSFFALAVASAGAAMFHDFLLWGALTISFVAFRFRLGALSKSTILALCLFSVMILQSAKSDYRSEVWSGNRTASVGTLMSTLVSEVSGDTLLNHEELAKLNSRMNQGWIISAIIENVPERIPHADGATIIAAVQDSLIPRALSGKSAVDQSGKVEHFTGLEVRDGTSFGLSVPGEAWANFGFGGILFMGVMGLFYGSLMRLCASAPFGLRTLPLWTPLIFLQAVKAETELLVVLNHQIKAIVFVLLMYFVVRRVLKLRI